MAELAELAWDSIVRLDRWLVANGWAGYDPYDLRGLPCLVHRSYIS